MSFLRRAIYRYVLTALLAGSTLSVYGQSPPSREYQIKSVFLFHFTQFVEWTAGAFPDANTPVVIGILGEDPFDPYLEKVIAGEKVEGHPLAIHQYKDIEEIATCHILFLNVGSNVKLERILEKLEGRSILTVSDADNFIQKGGMIRFVTIDKKIRLQINPDAAKAAGLTISSKLLSLAEIITPSKN